MYEIIVDILEMYQKFILPSNITFANALMRWRSTSLRLENLTFESQHCPNWT
jgi:hypothetical protein